MCLRSSRAAAAKQNQIYKQTGHRHDSVKHWAKGAHCEVLSVTGLSQDVPSFGLLPRPHSVPYAIFEEEALLNPESLGWSFSFLNLGLNM